MNSVHSKNNYLYIVLYATEIKTMPNAHKETSSCASVCSEKCFTTQLVYRISEICAISTANITGLLFAYLFSSNFFSCHHPEIEYMAFNLSNLLPSPCTWSLLISKNISEYILQNIFKY